jgi:hypothetical protein
VSLILGALTKDYNKAVKKRGVAAETQPGTIDRRSVFGGGGGAAADKAGGSADRGAAGGGAAGRDTLQSRPNTGNKRRGKGKNKDRDVQVYAPVVVKAK